MDAINYDHQMLNNLYENIALNSSQSQTFLSIRKNLNRQIDHLIRQKTTSTPRKMNQRNIAQK